MKANGKMIDKMDFVNGKKEGNGKYVWADGSSYIGEFKDNAFNGKGKYIWENNREYEGEWVNGKMEGKGIFKWPDGRRFEGNYINDKREGYGEYFFNNGKIFIEECGKMVFKMEKGKFIILKRIKQRKEYGKKEK